MTKQYFNEYEFKHLFSLAKTDPLSANLKYEEYIQKYPKDYIVYIHYASNLITLGNFDKAEQVLNYIVKESENTKVKKLSQIEKFNTKYNVNNV